MATSAFSNEFTYRKMVESGKEQEFDSLFDQAAKNSLAAFGKTWPMYIGGKQLTAQALLEEHSPIDRRILVGKFQKGTREHSRMAIEEARKAFESWSQKDYRERLSIFKKAVEKFREKKFELAAILSYENGKSRYESVGEVDEAIDFINYYIIEMERNKGYSRKNSISQSAVKVEAGFQGAPAEKPEKISIKLKPYGVFGVIAPFNFPISISVGMSTGAMITGNTVIFKPSSTDNMSMLTGLKIYEIFKEAGMPDGVFNYVTGPGSEVGDELAVNNGVSGIAFTGSRETGMRMAATSYAHNAQKVFVVEMGGKNPVIISKHADIDEAVEGTVSAAFGFAGQKCSALSRVYVHESIKEVFLSKLIERTRELKIGNPIVKGNYMGPLISEGAYARYVESVSKAKSAGRLLYGGARVNNDMDGFYVEPVIVEIRHDHELVHKELFLPFITVESFKDFGEAIKLANDVEYGLTAGMYSKNKAEIREFEKHIEAGTVYVNRAISATTGAVVGMHTFVGWKGSSLTGKGTGSKFYLEQFMREQSFSVTG
ncbi:MAG: aldehyde dehydrogenase family protein [Candidatus Marsarchaeota archaeon]|nr:aldehyde dehydrogenase family protein [Candidatus Marsarchaeota archaeon]